MGRAAACLIHRLGDLRSFTVDQTQLAPQLRITNHDEYPQLGVTRRRVSDGGVDDFRQEFVWHWIWFEWTERPRRIHRFEQADIAHGDLPSNFCSPIPPAPIRVTISYGRTDILVIHEHRRFRPG